MDNRNTILEELRRLSPAVANINRKNIYTVPFDYFEKFPERLFSIIKQKEQPLPKNQQAPFSVPAGYFETLAYKIIEKAKQQSQSDEISDELKDIAPLIHSLGRKVVWNVPEGYFETLASHILNKIKQQAPSIETSSELTEVVRFLSTIGTKPTFTVPTNYFETLAAEILNKVKRQHANEISEELELIAPLLNTISKTNVFTVPKGYFEEIKVGTPTNAHSSKVKSMFAGVHKMVKYAAAAIVGGVIVTGSIVFLNKEDSNSNNINPTVQNSQKIERYNANDLKKLSDQEIKEYLSSNGVEVEDQLIILDDQQDLDNLLKEMTEEEIKEYLEENSETGNIHSKEG